MRAIWKGAVSFGLVNVPIRLYSATENHDVQFRQVHREDGGRIKYQRVCNECGKQVAFDDIAKGYETEDGGMVVLDDSDFADLPSKTSKEIGVVKFVPADEIDPMWVRDGVIVMQTMIWPDEIRKPDFTVLDEDQHATKAELDMAKLLIDQLAGDFEPDEYEDDYAIALKALVRAKVEGGEVQAPVTAAEESGEVVDLLAALAKSVEKAKAARGEKAS